MFMRLLLNETGVCVLESTHCFELTDKHHLVAHEYGNSDVIILDDDNKTRNVLFKMNCENDSQRDFILGMEIIKNYFHRGRLDIKVIGGEEVLYGSLAFDVFLQHTKCTSSKIQCSFDAIGGLRGFPDGIIISHGLDRHDHEFATGPAIGGLFSFFWSCTTH